MNVSRSHDFVFNVWRQLVMVDPPARCNALVGQRCFRVVNGEKDKEIMTAFYVR